LGPIGFTAPWLLLGLLALPILWILLRAVPPAPVRRLFPGVALLLGLDDDAQESDRTPWWLLLLRSGAIAALILTQLLYKKPDLTMVLNGALAGLVSITAEPLMPSLGGAVLIGMVGGALVVFTVPLLDRLKIDDVVGAITAKEFY
ncbi:hypothetical protein LCGC14_1442330, partial [marine sediment metagenome]